MVRENVRKMNLTKLSTVDLCTICALVVSLLTAKVAMFTIPKIVSTEYRRFEVLASFLAFISINVHFCENRDLKDLTWKISS